MAEEIEKTAARLDWEGQGLLSEAKVDEAIEHFTRALEADPNYGSSYLHRAEAFRQKGSDAEAQQDEINYNVLVAGGRFGAPGGEHSVEKALLGPEPPRRAGPGGPSEGTATSAPTAPASLAENPVTESQAAASERPRQEREGEPEASQEGNEEGREMAERPGEVEEEFQSRPGTELHPFHFDGGGPTPGVWFLNKWGFRDGFTYWTVERFFRALLLMAGLAVIGALIGRVSVCSEEVEGNFWTGCGVEMLSFALGGAALGGLISLFVTWGLRR